ARARRQPRAPTLAGPPVAASARDPGAWLLPGKTSRGLVANVTSSRYPFRRPRARSLTASLRLLTSGPRRAHALHTPLAGLRCGRDELPAAQAASAPGRGAARAGRDPARAVRAGGRALPAGARPGAGRADGRPCDERRRLPPAPAHAPARPLRALPRGRGARPRR